MTVWSVVAIAQCRLTGVQSFYATRCLLGLLEGGFIPDVVLYLSFFYTSKELPIRLSFFWSAFMGTQIVSALLAYGILHLRGTHGWAGWRWLFALEGALTCLIGIFSWFYLPPSPTQTKGYLRGKDGWFTEHEEKIMVNRILRDDPAKGGMHNRQGLTLTLLWEALCDYDLWPLYLIGLSYSIPNSPINAYLTLNLKQLGFNTFQTNLLTIPAYVLFLIQLLAWTWVSEKWNNRMMIVIVSQVWCFPLILALELLPNGASPWVWYACSALVVGYPYVHAILGASSRLLVVCLPRYCIPRHPANRGLASSRPDLEKRRLRPHTNSRQRPVQHVRAGLQHHCLQHLPHRGQAVLPHRQQGHSRHYRLDRHGHHRYQVVLHLEEQDKRRCLGSHDAGAARRVHSDDQGSRKQASRL